MTLEVVLHAPTAGALARARRNLANLVAEEPDAAALLIASADAVDAALATPDPATDRHLRLCRKTLARRGLTPPAAVATVESAVQELARLQAAGRAYIHA